MIAIKGFEMPENCLRCPMQFGGWCYVSPPEVDEKVAPTVDEAWEQGKPDWCQLVEVPDEAGNCSEIPNNSTDCIRGQMDLIDRKRALEEMTFSGGIEHYGVLYVPFRDVTKHLRNLPSIHPEADEWCTTCKEYDHEKHNCPRYNRVIREAVEEIQENQIPENSAWFRISETLVDESKGDITAEQAVDKIRDYLKRMEKPERKKGKWINHQNDGYVDCPFCGALTTCSDGIEDLHFCFSCGAELEGEQE